MTYTLLPIVEGDGEVQAIPVLLRRICGDLLGRHDVQIRQPWRLQRSKMVKPSEIGKVYAALANGATEGQGGVIVILDQDDDANVTSLAAEVAAPMQLRFPIEVVVASREYEAWFLGSITSLQIHRAVKDDAHFDGNPEGPRNAKGRLEKVMHESYRETLHQSAFSGIMSLTEAQSSCRSFQMLVDGVERLLRSQ